MKSKNITCISRSRFLPSLLILCFAVLMITSCEKEENQVTQTINVTLFKNQPYSYAVPENESDDPYRITDQASHYLRSDLTELCFAAGGPLTYEYTPALNYTGKDRVVIANVEEKHGKGHHGKGNGGKCGGNDEMETETTVIINFTIIDINTKQLINDQMN